MPDSLTPELEFALRHQRALQRLARQLCASPADADDAVQYAVSQVALGRWRAERPLLAFLRTTLRNYASNLRKLGARRRAHEAVAIACAGGSGFAVSGPRSTCPRARTSRSARSRSRAAPASAT